MERTEWWKESRVFQVGSEVVKGVVVVGAGGVSGGSMVCVVDAV